MFKVVTKTSQVLKTWEVQNLKLAVSFSQHIYKFRGFVNWFGGSGGSYEPRKNTLIQQLLQAYQREYSYTNPWPQYISKRCIRRSSFGNSQRSILPVAL